MQASDAGWLLNALARGGSVELEPERATLIDALSSAELIRRAPDAREERGRLDQLKAELAQIAQARAGGDASADLIGRERGLRTAIIELSERCAESEAACEVRTLGSGGPYRGGAGGGDRWQLTQRGRTLLADLAPRASRIGPMTIDEFGAQMKALRDGFAWRAQRAVEIGRQMRHINQLGRARLATPIGLSGVRGEPPAIARAFDAAFENLRGMPTTFSVEQDAAAAEALCLAVPQLAQAEALANAQMVYALRVDLMNTYAPGQTEDAADAAVMISALGIPARQAHIARAVDLAQTMIRDQRRAITLPLALIATAGDEAVADHLPIAIANVGLTITNEVRPEENMAVAVLLTFARGDINVQIERWRTIRQYLARFAPEGMAVAAALLAWVALEPAELLDNLRLASAALKKYRLVNGGAETMTLATKLLVGMSVLAAGREGDYEESLALAPVAHARVPHLGLHGSLTALPVIGSAVVAFHRTVLDAAAAWEQIYQPTHSPYVFGTGRRSYGWG